MFEVQYPFFKKGRVLKIEMLENLRNFPRDILDIYGETLSDGIISGLTPAADGRVVTFSKGMVKHNGSIYLINSPTTISCADEDINAIITLNFYDEVVGDDFRTLFAEIEMNDRASIESNQIELCRFKLKTGAYLRDAYQGLYDFVTEYNTINIAHTLYSGYKEPTISVEILKYFAKEALEANPKNAMDITFCFMCLNSARIERQVILNYVAHRTDQKLRPMTNIVIHDALVKILDTIKREIGRKSVSADARHRIILD
ncbi:MAG: hypothetical protein LBL35_08530 [Clostridiales bacterium]|nr:hypothetical protein [Clostridiales bacterium]